MPKSDGPGSIAWFDLTVSDAESIRDFYSAVVGWRPAAVSMGDYDDWCMAPSEGAHPVAGICHKVGENAALPSQWLIYVRVENLDQSVEKCLSHGGKVLFAPRNMGPKARFCVIEDPAGAVMALYWEDAP